MNDKLHFIEKLARYVVERLEAAGNHAVPTADEAAAMLRACYIVKGDKVQRRAKMPSTASKDEKALFAALLFHAGVNVNLHAPIMHSVTVGMDRWNQLDSLALGVQIVVSGGSVGVQRWQGVLGTK
jgi:hypothetical protein